MFSNSANINASYVSRCNLCAADLLDRAKGENLNEIVILFEATEGGIPASHPRHLKQSIIQKVTSPNKIEFLKRTRQGKFIAITKDLATANELLRIQELIQTPVRSSIQIENITTRFLLHSIPTDVSCEEIAQELWERGIACYEVRRFCRGGEGARIPTMTVLVTKLGTQLPEKVTLWFERHRVSLFVDRPRQCVRCFSFEHSVRNCARQQVCPKCGSHHDGKDCGAVEPHCINCDGSHSATDHTCPRYKKEEEILSLKSRLHVSLAEARRQYRVNEPKGQSFATTLTSTAPTVTKVNQIDTDSIIKEVTVRLETQMSNIVDTIMKTVTKMFEDWTAKLKTMIKAYHGSHADSKGRKRKEVTNDEDDTPSGGKSTASVSSAQKNSDNEDMDFQHTISERIKTSSRTGRTSKVSP